MTEFAISGITKVIDVDGGKILIKPMGGNAEWWADNVFGMGVGDVVKFRHSTTGLWLAA